MVPVNVPPAVTYIPLSSLQVSFPLKLHSLLEDFEKAGQEHIISWAHHGGAFKIHDPEAFADEVMQKYFNGTKFNSFRRQLQIYGFRFIKDKNSPDHGSYVHPFFLKGKTELCSKMIRQKIKGNKKLRRMTHNEKVKVEINQENVGSNLSLQHVGNNSLDQKDMKEIIHVCATIDEMVKCKDQDLSPPTPLVHVWCNNLSNMEQEQKPGLEGNFVTCTLDDLTLPLETFSKKFLNDEDDEDFFEGRSFFTVE